MRDPIKEAIRRVTAGEIEPVASHEVDPDQVSDMLRFNTYAYSEQQVGLPHFRVIDPKSGIAIGTFTPGTNKSVNMHAAWAAARESRNAGTMIRIATGVIKSGTDAAAKMEETVREYKHESIRDMSLIGITFENISMTSAAKLFYLLRVAAGQEKSTRYQGGFGERALVPLNNTLSYDLNESARNQIETDFKLLGDEAMRFYAQYTEPVQRILRDIFSPADNEQEKSLKLRTLDCVSFWLPMAVETGMVLFTSIQHWQRVVAYLRGSEIQSDVLLGEQIQYLLNPPKEVAEKLNYVPEAGELLKYTEPTHTFQWNLENVKTLLKKQRVSSLPGHVEVSRHESEVVNKEDKTAKVDAIVVRQILSAIFSHAEFLQVDRLAKSIRHLWKDIISTMGTSLTRFNPTDEVMAITTMNVTVETSMAAVRDLSRHRALARFITMPIFQRKAMSYFDVVAEIKRGFVLPLHVTELEEMKDINTSMTADLKAYYEKILSFAETVLQLLGDNADYSFILGLLPLAHRTQLTMHGDPKTWHYMIDLRTAVGGRIDYRLLVSQMGKSLIKRYPIFQNFFVIHPVDIRSKEEFYGRS